MRRRLKVQEIIEEIVSPGKVYFQAPESVKMVYPCARIDYVGNQTIKADDTKHVKHERYTVTYITKNADSLIPDKIEKLLYCSLDRMMKVDNLYHFIFTLYL